MCQLWALHVCRHIRPECYQFYRPQVCKNWMLIIRTILTLKTLKEVILHLILDVWSQSISFRGFCPLTLWPGSVPMELAGGFVLRPALYARTPALAMFNPPPERLSQTAPMYIPPLSCEPYTIRRFKEQRRERVCILWDVFSAEHSMRTDTDTHTRWQAHS